MKQHAKDKNFIYNNIVISISLMAVSLFLSGKIIDIPHGTHNGGIIGAIGVGVILIVMFIIICGVFRYESSRQKQKNNKFPQ